MENPLQGILVLVAAVLLVAVTGGVGYLTVADWRDRRLRNQEKRETRQRTTPKPSSKPTPKPSSKPTPKPTSKKRR